MFIQCYVFLINCGLSLVCIYVSLTFLLEFNLVKSTVSSSDAQCEICLTKLILTFLRARSFSWSSGDQQPCKSQQQTCKNSFSNTSCCFFSLYHTLPEDYIHSPGVSGQQEQRHWIMITPEFSCKSCRGAMHTAQGKSWENHMGRTLQFSCQFVFLGAAGNGEMKCSKWWESYLWCRKYDSFLLTMLCWREYCFLFFSGRRSRRNPYFPCYLLSCPLFRWSQVLHCTAIRLNPLTIFLSVGSTG